MYKIAQGSGGVPTVEDADKGKYLHANESTGDLEWATAGGTGGGVLVVHQSCDELEGYTLDKTWQEIFDADCPIIVDEDTDAKFYVPITSVFIDGPIYIVANSLVEYATNSADGYPKRSGGK